MKDTIVLCIYMYWKINNSMYLWCYFLNDLKSNKTLPDCNVEYELICDRKGIVEQIHLRSLLKHTRC